MGALSEPALTGLDRRLAALRVEIAGREPAALARRCGADLRDGQLNLAVWGRAVVVGPPDFVARETATGAALDALLQALVAYYLATADGTGPAGSWIAFSELPDGRFYTRAFQGYTGQALARGFGDDLPRFSTAATRLGGESVPFANAAFRFQVLPHVPILVACWLGDEEFPTSYKLLFDAHSHHQLPTDACAIMGSTLTRRLLA